MEVWKLNLNMRENEDRLEMSKKKSNNNRQENTSIPKFVRSAENRVVKSDLYDTLKPIYYPSKICGLLPVKFRKGKYGKYHGQLDMKQVAYGMLVLCALLSAQIYGLYRDLRNGWQNSTRLHSQTSITVTCSDVGAVISVVVSAILNSTRCWHYVQSSFDNLMDLDVKLGIVSTKHVRKRSVILIVMTFVCLFVISILDFISWTLASQEKKTDSSSEKGAINYSPIYVMYFVVMAFEIQYAMVVTCLGERFIKLNKTIENLTRTKVICDYFHNDMGAGMLAVGSRERNFHQSIATINGEVQSKNRRNKFSELSENNEVSKNGSTEIIDQLIVLHGILCDTTILINKAFGGPTLFVAISCLIHLIITSYFLYNADSTRSMFVLTLQVLWIIFHTFRLYLVVQPCYLVSTKARKTGALVSQALAAHWEPEAKKQLEIFSLQLLHRPIEFDVCGLFFLDRGLVTSIVGTVTTYLVILVQFQTADETTSKTTEWIKNVSLKNTTSTSLPS